MCRDMQENGVNVDRPRKDELSKAILAKEKRLFKEMKEIAGRDFAPTKTDDIRESSTMSSKRRSSSGRRRLSSVHEQKGFGGVRGCEGSAVRRLRPTHDRVARMRQDARHVPGQPSGRRGRPRTTELEVHRYGIGKVLLPAAEPAEPEALRRALRNEPEQHIREIYIASKGNILMAFDLSQVEPRVAAYLSNDPVFIEGVESGDIHTTNAKRIFDNHPYLMDPKEAKEGKGKPMRDISRTCLGNVVHVQPGDGLEKTTVGRLRRHFAQDHRGDGQAKEIFKVYYAYVSLNAAICKRSGFLTAGALSGVAVGWGASGDVEGREYADSVHGRRHHEP